SRSPDWMHYASLLRPSPFFLRCSASPRDLHSFPTRRSSDLCPLRSSRPHCQRPERRASTSCRPCAPTNFRLPFAGERHLVAMKRSEEHTSELQSRFDLVCRLLLEKKKTKRHRCMRPLSPRSP